VTRMHDRIYWAVNKFNKEIAAGKDARDFLGLLWYIRKVYGGPITVWARESLTSEAIEAHRAGFTLL
jgi:hypothetical protein